MNIIDHMESLIFGFELCLIIDHMEGVLAFVF